MNEAWRRTAYCVKHGIKEIQVVKGAKGSRAGIGMLVNGYLRCSCGFSVITSVNNLRSIKAALNAHHA